MTSAPARQFTHQRDFAVLTCRELRQFLRLVSRFLLVSVVAGGSPELWKVNAHHDFIAAAARANCN